MVVRAYTVTCTHAHTFCLGVPTPTIDSIKQLSQSSVKLTLSVPDDRCVGSYRVDTIADGWSNSTNSNVLPIVYVSGLNVCRFNYTFVASITTPDLVQGAESAPMSFDADLSGIPLGASDCITTSINIQLYRCSWYHKSINACMQ